jgi:hypothetical protein
VAGFHWVSRHIGFHGKRVRVARPWGAPPPPPPRPPPRVCGPGGDGEALGDEVDLGHGALRRLDVQLHLPPPRRASAGRIPRGEYMCAATCGPRVLSTSR